MLKKLYITLTLAAFALVSPVRLQAAEAGIYTAATTAYYAHPETGAVEDPGNNAGIGQPMTESVLQSAALVEIDKNKNTYVTLRIGMIDQLGQVSFASQSSKNVSFQAASAQLMQKNTSNQTGDYRFKISSETATIRISVYVNPMGRSAIFYGKLSGLKAGSGDFKTVLTSKDLETEKPVSENTPSVNGSVSSNGTVSSGESALSEGSTSVTVGKEETNSSSAQQNETETEHNQETTSGGPEIVEVVEEESAETEEKSSGLTVVYNNKDTEEKEAETVVTMVEDDVKNNRILLAVCIIAGVDLLATLVFGICYVRRRRKERQIIGG